MTATALLQMLNELRQELATNVRPRMFEQATRGKPTISLARYRLWLDDAAARLERARLHREAAQLRESGDQRGASSPLGNLERSFRGTDAWTDRSAAATRVRSVTKFERASSD